MDAEAWEELYRSRDQVFSGRPSFAPGVRTDPAVVFYSTSCWPPSAV
jgi:hypothetical protein